MKEEYLFNPRSGGVVDKYDEHETFKRVYLTQREDNKYTLHYSLMSASGTIIPQKRTYALSSFKRIFAYVEKNRKE
jgi:hypothetical protein